MIDEQRRYFSTATSAGAGVSIVADIAPGAAVGRTTATLHSIPAAGSRQSLAGEL